MRIKSYSEGRGTIHLLECDECHIHFKKDSKYAKKKRHFCSRSCSNASQKCGVLLDDFREACRKKLGCDYPMQSEAVRQKSKETCKEKYGVESIGSLALASYAKSLGVVNVSQLPEHKEKVRQTSKKKYGVDHPLAAPDVRIKISKTVESKYGVHNFVQSDVFKAKAAETHMLLRGVSHHSQTKEFKENIDWHKAAKKRHATMKAHGQYATSRSEEKFYLFLCDAFGEKNVVRNALVGSSMIDFYVSSCDVYVQFDGVYWHGLDRPLEEITQFKHPRDKIIFDTVLRDAKQVDTFASLGLRLVRVTDKEFALASRDCTLGEAILKRIKEKEQEDGY